MNLDLVCEGFDMSNEIQVDTDMPQAKASLSTGFRRKDVPVDVVVVGAFLSPG